MPPKPEQQKPDHGKLSPGSRFKVEHREEQLRVTYRWYQKGMWMFLAWCPLFVVIYAANAPTNLRNGEIIGVVWGGLIITGLCYLTLVVLVNRTVLVVTHATLLLRKGPLPWPESLQVLPTQQIVQFFVEKDQGTKTKGRGTRSYSLHVLMQGGTSERLFYGNEHRHELLTLQGEIERWLGRESSPVERQEDRKREQW